MARTVVAFGNFDLEGGRSWVIRTGLIEQGFAIQLCRTEAKGIIRKYLDLKKKWRSVGHRAEAIYVPFLGHWILPLAWMLGRRRGIPVIFDAFLSLYDTEVYDRRRVSRFHPKAWFLWSTDWLCCRLCDLILVDTQDQKRYLAEHYRVPLKKILPLPVGCRTDLFIPLTSSTSRETFTVEFHGTYIPLQGIDIILHAAHLLEKAREPAHFLLIGKGQTYTAMRSLAKRLQLSTAEFIDAVPIEKLPSLIATADVCLGIFGTTEKADRVIPNKAYETINCAKPLVTARTNASLQFFRDGIDAALVNPGDPQDLAKRLLQLKHSMELRRELAINGRKLSLEKFQPRQITSPLAQWLKTKLS